jgi:hypothetical protein
MRQPEMDNFRDVLTFYDVFDIGFTGAPWTFDNKQKRDKHESKIGQGDSVGELVVISGSSLHHLVSSRFDHVRVLHEFCRDESASKPPRIARYEIMWERDETLPEEIHLAWAAGNQIHDLFVVAENLKKVMASLTCWSRDKFRQVTWELEKLRKLLEELTARVACPTRKMKKKLRNGWMSSYTGRR